jgi:hypothetical protein
MGSGPLAQPLFYQYKRTFKAAILLLQLGSTQASRHLAALESFTTDNPNKWGKIPINYRP